MNTEPDGTCKTIKNQYWKNSLANFIGVNGTFGATGVIVFFDDSAKNKHRIVIADPRKRFGNIEIPSGEWSPTLLGTDYKSPNLVIEIEETYAYEINITDE